MTDSGPVVSAEQDQWADICAAVRAELAKSCQLLPAMKADEVSSFIKAVDDAMWNEVKARTFDEQIESRRRELERQGLYGS